MNEFTGIYDSPLGKLTIKATDENVIALMFDKNKTVQEIVQLSNDHPLVKKCISQLHEYFEGKRNQFELPLQQPGTSFQQKVWNELEKIDYGKTISYMELSKRIGDVKAIRAVGTTNGKNNIAIIVPCHRVIGSNGDLTGYGGELWRKKWLLDHENKYANGVQTLF